MDGQCHKSYLHVIFKWVEETSQFNEYFTKIYNEDSDTGYFIEADVPYPEKLHELHNDLPFLPEERKLKKLKNWQPTCIIKKNMLFT